MAASSAATPVAAGGEPGGGGRLKLLFMDRRDIHNTWGQVRFGATVPQRVADPPQKPFTVKCCRRREDGAYDVWGFQGADFRPWKIFRCRTRDGLHFEDVRVVLERTGDRWAHTRQRGQGGRERWS
jgi:hypothetical protein